jgi:PAS domain S-box-containing protein
MNYFFANLKIKYKLLIIYSSVFFVILSTSGYFIYSNVKEQIETQIEIELSKSIDIVTKILETISKNNSKAKLKILASKNKEIVEYYYNLHQNGEISKKEAIDDLTAIFAKQKIGKTGYLAATYNDKINKKYMAKIHPHLKKDTDMSDFEIVKTFMMKKNGYFEYLWKNESDNKFRKKALYSIYFEPWDLAITATTYLSELLDVISIEDIKNDIQNYKIGTTGYIYIINSKADILYHPLLENDKISLQTKTEIDKIFGTIITKKNGKIVYNWKKNLNSDVVGTKKIALFRYLPKLDWYITASAFEEEFNAPLYKLKSTFIVSFLLLGIFIILTSFWISSYITMPLLNIIDKFKDVNQNSYKEKIDIKGNDEFGELSKHYNTFIDKLNMYSTKSTIEANKFNAILNNTSAIIYIKSLDGKYEIVNKQFEKLYNLSNNEIIGNNSKNIFGKKVAFNLKKNELKVVKESKSISFEEEVELNGKKYFFISVKFPLFDINNKITSIGGISTDISSIKEAELRVKNLNKELEYNVTQRTSDLLLSNINLEKSINDLKQTQSKLIQSEKMASLGDLVAGISHEINTPVGLGVTGITHLEYITKEIVELYKTDNISQEEFEEYLDSSVELTSSIHTNLNRAADLIRSFKKVAVDQSSEEKRRFNIKEYLNEILTSLQFETKNSNCTFEVKCDKRITISSFPGAFSQIITNFVMNSIVHGFKNLDNGIISIEISVVDDNLIIKYKDNGHGISEKNLSKIYDPFFTTNRNHGGSGLGLNIIYNIITSSLKGKITCSSSLNKGTEFIVIIPINS